jgi:hypothetical protein
MKSLNLRQLQLCTPTFSQLVVDLQMPKKLIVVGCLSLAGTLNVSSCFLELLVMLQNGVNALSSVCPGHVHLIIGQIPAAPLYPCTDAKGSCCL